MNLFSRHWAIFQIFSLLITSVACDDLIRSSALLSCMENSQFTASSFDVVLYRSNGSVNFEVSAISTLSGYFTAHVSIIAYGISIINEDIKLCDIQSQLCPMTPGHFDVPLSAQTIGSDVIGNIPGIAYKIPDLDGIVRVTVYPLNGTTSTPVACVEATLSNDKTVSTKYAAWPIAALTFAGLLTASVVWLFGHVSTSAHIASNIVSLFYYFQGVAIIGMMAVDRLPPVAAAWCQNFMWTMGLISVPFMQDIFNWYVQATGGTTTNILPNASIMSISVQKVKRSMDTFGDLIMSHFTPNHKLVASRNSPYSYYSNTIEGSVGSLVPALLKRATNTTTSPAETTDETLDDYSATTLVLRGIQRVAFLANIEITSLFLTGFVFFLILCVFTIIIFVLAKLFIELLAKMGAVQQTSFMEFRTSWRTVIKGVLYRLCLLTLPQLTVICLWELTKHDSPGTLILAIIAYIVVAALLSFGAYKTISLARRSMILHKNPAYILYSDPEALNRWGFLYVQFRASAYFYIVPLLAYTFVKCAFIAFGQGAGKVQAVCIFIVELGYLILISYYKPYMDKSTNGFNIGISAINFINALFFMFFSAIFGLPAYVAGVMGVVFFVLNAVFSLVLLIMIIVSCVWAVFSKNPETRYQPMRDDRESFIPNNGGEKSAVTELDALGASARDGHESYAVSRDDEESELDSKSSISKVDSSFPSARLSRNTSDAGPFSDYNSSNTRLTDSGINSSSTTLVRAQEDSYSGYHQNNNNMSTGGNPAWRQNSGY